MRLEHVAREGVEGCEKGILEDNKVRFNACAGLAVLCSKQEFHDVPRAWKIPESSEAMHPPPTMQTFAGSCSSSKRPSESIPSSSPSMWVARTGRAPTAMTNLSAVTRRSTSETPGAVEKGEGAIETVLASTNRECPVRQVTPSLLTSGGERRVSAV